LSREIVDTVLGVVLDSTRHGPEQHLIIRFALSSELDETALWGSLNNCTILQLYSLTKSRCKARNLIQLPFIGEEVAYNKSMRRRDWDSMSEIGSNVSTRWDLLTGGLPLLCSCNIHT